ncbi:MAG: selenide, water dikinase [Thermoanaerobacteraceae bacterium]|nr:selenide, water dikinase [Thermoanaerobacteraceae bacterium]MDN5311085.1 selenide, water dikinase [Thermoanaerobacteraceae bacterium]
MGLDTSDDAAVYKINDDLALIHTVDFFTPVVDDPYTFGQIAACNALSDIYAMGGNPILALNVVAFPEELVESILPDVLRGGADKVIEAGAVVGGGHSIKSPEPIYGLSIIGEISSDKIMTNAGAKPGDVLILTKPLGIGVATTALKANMLSKETERQAVEVMSTLNREASKAAVQTGVNAITDITGFGLLGHAFEMAEASKVTLRLKAGLLPILSGMEGLAAMGILPAGLYHNKKYLKGKISISSEVPEALTDLAFDPQTSGGLLISVSEDRASVLLKLLKESGVKDATVIGRVVEPQDYRIILE